MNEETRLHVKSVYDAYGFTTRQREICDRLLTGEVNKEIAWELHLSESTVKNYMTLILERLGTHDRLETALALLGVIPVPNDPPAVEADAA